LGILFCVILTFAYLCEQSADNWRNGIGHENEFENPGVLPKNVEELLTADESYPRNPVLTKFFKIARLCERAGYGFYKMLE